MRKALALAFAVTLALPVILVAACKSGGTTPTPTPAPTATSVAGPATKLAFSIQPAGAAAGTPFTNQPLVTIEDANGNPVINSAAQVTLSITPGTGASGAVLSGTTSVGATSGRAIFSDLSIDLLGSGYALTATSQGLTSATSDSFDVAVAPTPASGTPAKIVFTIQPATATAGVVFATPPGLTVEDVDGYPVSTSRTIVTIVITPGTGASGAILSGTKGTIAMNGVATFGDLAINLPGTGYTLTASSPGLPSVTSDPFDVVVKPTPTPLAGVASKVVFTTEPAGATAGAPFATQPVVTVQDAYGNTVAESRSSITLTITSGTGASGAKLSGTTTVTEVNGVATFTGVSIDMAGAGYTLTATRSGPITGASSAFDVAAK